MISEQKISLEAVPLLCEGVDLQKLEVSMEEGVILSQLDGQLRVRHLKIITGMDEQQLFPLLQNLQEKGIIILHTPKPKTEAKPEIDRAKLPTKPLLDLKTIPQGEQFEALVNKLMEILDKVDYFQLLGIGNEAKPEEIKRAYYRLSKIFHPDRYFRKVSPEFRHKLQVVFKKINTAYQVLSNEESKKAYLAQMREKGAEFAGEELKLEVVKKVYTGPKWKLGLKEEDKQKAREEKLKKIVEGIKKTSLGGQLEKAQRLFQLAQEEISKKNFKSARTNLKLAMQINPAEKREYEEALKKIELLENRSQAETSYEQGKAAEQAGDYKSALRLYKEALSSDPNNPQYIYSLAKIMIRYTNDWEKGKALVLRLLNQNQKKADYFYLLGLAFKGLGQKQAAKVQLEKALEIDPKHKEAQKELKLLKKS